jgi:hypothetical protein
MKQAIDLAKSFLMVMINIHLIAVMLIFAVHGTLNILTHQSWQSVVISFAICALAAFIFTVLFRRNQKQCLIEQQQAK